MISSELSARLAAATSLAEPPRAPQGYTGPLSDEQQRMVDAALSGRDVIVEATVGSGKALLDDSRVPTPLGWRLVRDIKVGDELYGRLGQRVRVKGVYQQGLKRVYRVSFADGRSTLCSIDHNWSVRLSSNTRTVVWRTLTTGEILDRGIKRTEGRFDVYRFRIPTHAAIEMDEVEFSLHPYVVGALLGNGSCTEKGLTISCETDEVPNKVAELLGATVKRRSQANYSWDFSRDGRRLLTSEVLASVPELIGLSGSKSIPEAYLRGSVEQRLQLVQGLMDTDGSVTSAEGRYNVSFSSTSRELAMGLRDVLGSLGMTASVREDRRVERYSTGECISLGINVRTEDKPRLFSVGRKLALAEEALRHESTVRAKRRDYSEVAITAVDDLGYEAPMTCFEVDDEEHLFLADDYVVTHNTSTIQHLTTELSRQGLDVLYLTYSRLLKADAQARVLDAGKVQNYHGLVYPHLLRLDIKTGLSESVQAFNQNWGRIKHGFREYDAIVVDEYQDINEEYAQLLRNVQSRNADMLTVMVGDLEQKVSSNTRLDAGKFARTFTKNAALIPFTQSFRMGPYQANRLSQGWGKPVVGMNDDHEVLYLDEDQAFELARSTPPGDLLVLGARNGPMPELLNRLETEEPQVFNKTSVYASIRDRGEQGSYDQQTAVFTTYDSSKGMERDTVIVFGFDDQYWDIRLNRPDADPEVLRNVFLVAASRGKRKIAFVSRKGLPGREPYVPEGVSGGRAFTIGYMTGLKLKDLVQRPGKYPQPMRASDMFDFKYAEAVSDAYDALECERLDDGSGEEIEINRLDGLIDLSPAVGNYQEIMHFDDYDVEGELRARREGSALGHEESVQASGEPWGDALALTALDTDQLRYLMQVDAGPSDEADAKLEARLSEHLPRDARVQPYVEELGKARSRHSATKLGFCGRIDAVYQDMPWELKFVTELTREMFLQTAMYCVMGRFREGRLWNTRTGELWRVRVPDEQKFLDLVTSCVTKDQYNRFERP